MKSFYFSIGLTYVNGGHPFLRTTSNDLIRVEAESEEGARQIFVDAVGSNWAFSYDAERAAAAISRGNFSTETVPLDEARRSREFHSSYIDASETHVRLYCSCGASAILGLPAEAEKLVDLLATFASHRFVDDE